MRHRVLGIVFVLLGFIAALTIAMQPPLIQSPDPIDELVVFGDSLSDTGIVFQATGGMYPPPPYFRGRYSNGHVWVEYLADRLQLSSTQINNFAYGGATAAETPNGLVPSLRSQVQSFTRTHPQANAQALYVLWAGANDYLQGTATTSAPVEPVMEAIDTLATVGAKRILVANLPNLGQLPATRNSPQAAALNEYTQSYNQRLRRSIKQLSQQQSDLAIVKLDVNALYQSAITNPATYRFTNVTQACFAGSQSCENPEQFLFWDGIHPTTTAHQVLGEAAFSAIQEAGIIQPQLAELP